MEVMLFLEANRYRMVSYKIRMEKNVGRALAVL